MLALTALAAVAGAASAAHEAKHDSTPCWKVLTNDAFDGKVDGIYPTVTYAEAVRHLPTDVQSYSTIAQVITQARQDALQQSGKGVKPDPARCGFALGNSGSGTGTTSNTGGDGKGPIPGVIDSVGSGSADSFPVALIVIAVIAAVLLLGGGAGFLLRRKQRRQQELEQASGASSGSDDGPLELTP